MSDVWDLGKIEEVPFKYNGNSYLLVEASEDAVRLYRNGIMKRTKVGPNGQPTAFEDVADIDSELLSHCLFKIEGDKRVKLTLEQVRALGSKVCKKLNDKLKEISELDTDMSPEAIDQQIEQLQKQKEELAKAKGEAKNV